MASHGIRDRVAIIGMGCTRFGERWDRSADDLVVDAVTEAVASTPSEPPSGLDSTASTGRCRSVASVPNRLTIWSARGLSSAWKKRSSWLELA